MTNYIYICGASKTGSTLLDMILGRHYKGASLGEFSYLGKALALDQTCGCGEGLKVCKNWSGVFERVKHEKGIDLREAPYALRQWDTQVAVNIDKKQQTSAYILQAKVRSKYTKFNYMLPKPLRLPLPKSYQKGIENTIYLYDQVLKCWDKDFVIDSSKNITKGIALVEKCPDKAKIILTVRDGRGSFNSNIRYGFSRKQSLDDWFDYYSLANKILFPNVSDENLFVLKYEELVTNLESTIKKLCDWLGIEFEEEMLDLSHGENHMVEGNTTRFNRSKGIHLDERWRKELSKDELVWFEARAGQLNQKFGYL